MRGWTGAAATAILLAGAVASPAEAGCNRQVINRTGHFVTVALDGGPAVTVPPHRSHSLRYRASGQLDIAVYCRAPLRGASLGPEEPAFQASYATVAVLDRCYVEIDGGGTQPVALNNPRQGDVVVAPYELACPPAR